MTEKLLTLINKNNLDISIEINLLCAFEYNDNKYIIYTKNEKDCDGNVIVYSGKISNLENKQFISNVNNEEYDNIKQIIKKMIYYSGEKYEI